MKIRRDLTVGGSNAFTIVELLVVLAVIAILLALQLPALTRVQNQNRQVQCAANLKQLTLAHIVYGNEFNDRLPQSPGSAPWDVPRSFTDQLGKYGVQRAQFYCPANPDQNRDGLWNVNAQERATGYMETFPGTSNIATNDLNPTLTPSQPVSGSVAFPAPRASTRVLVADMTISDFGQTATFSKFTYNYTAVHASPGGGFPSPPIGRTSHLDTVGKYPSGANLGMLDGHVAWRNFTAIVSHNSTSLSVGFWW
jgi:prepilin-type N-terminal cleavage/methylation domain-containing protein/prepilin-type processing-associated H-X9-DG protein